jgi:hypothetical protein
MHLTVQQRSQGAAQTMCAAAMMQQVPGADSYMHSPRCYFEVHLPDVTISPVHALAILNTPVAKRLA